MTTFLLGLCGTELTFLGCASYLAATPSHGPTAFDAAGFLSTANVLGVVLLGLMMWMLAALTARTPHRA